ncbi:hypothetical protein L0222_28790, partial [bacterium]|nr:hypothetical protein [bacterium]
NNPWLAGFQLTDDVILLDLTAAWPTYAGASMAINSGSRPRARRWSRTIYEAYPLVHGLYYCSSMNANRPAIAFYERSRSAIAGAPVLHRALADPGISSIVEQCAQNLGYFII